VRVLVCGSRDWNDRRRIKIAIGRLLEHYGDLTIIHGACRGADRIADEIAEELGLTRMAFPITRSEWRSLGPAAGPLRNRRMLDQQPSLVLAFSNGTDGTQGTVDEARKRGIPVRVIGQERSA
jgi:hypothetical protein